MSLSYYEEVEIEDALRRESRRRLESVLASAEAFQRWLRWQLPRIWKVLKATYEAATIVGWVRRLFGL